MEQSIPLMTQYKDGDPESNRSELDETDVTDFLPEDYDETVVECILPPEEEAIEKTPEFLSNRTKAYLCLMICKSYLIAALPRFMQPGGLKSQRELHPTAYLDALRGYAAWIVFHYHTYSWTSSPVLQLPFIRVLFAGPGMVAIFFVISGYVLSYRILKQIRSRDVDTLLDSLTSATFRRYMRLYLSTCVATFVAMIFVQLGWIRPDKKKANFLLQLFDWVWDASLAGNPFADINGWVRPGVFRTSYLDQMWTIPVEYRGSMVLFAFATAVCKLSTRGRYVASWVVIVLCYSWRAVYAAEFLVGFFIADVSLGRHPQRWQHGIQLQDAPTLSRWQLAAKHSGQLTYALLLVPALFLLGQPDPPIIGYVGPFPWQYLSKLIPWYYGDAAYTFWLSIGGAMVVFSLDSCSVLQRPFEWGFSQYLGELSFGIYAMHNSIVWSLFKNVLEPWRVTSLGDAWWTHIPVFLITSFAVLVMADYFTRVDKRVVRFGKWVQDQTFVKWE